MLAGLMTLQRPQDAIFTLVVGMEICSGLVEWVRERRWERLPSLIAPVLIFVAGLVLMFLPQIVAWRALYGKVLPNVQQESMGFSFDWLHPRIIQVLLSSRHGLLSWTPLVLLGLVGLVFLYKRDKILALALSAVFLLQLYVVSCWPHWYQGASFGGRMFVSCSATFVLGLAALIDWIGDRVSFRWIVSIGSLFVVWNYVLLYQYGTGMISREAEVYWPQVIKNTIAIVGRFIDAFIFIFVKRM